jgi:ribonuclease P protein component
MCFTLHKQEILRSKISIDQLFQKGMTFQNHPFRIIWLFCEEKTEFPTKVLFIVPKKLIPLASNRNLIKRRMRESFRKNKLELNSSLENNSRHIHVAILYNYNMVLDYTEIEKKIILSLSKLAIKI